jgi:Xaa-Pro aminopeptidase
MVMKERRSRILQHAAEVGCDGVAAFEPANVFYLTGFWGEAIAICTENGTKLVAPKLEYSRALHSSVDCEVVSTERGTEMLASFVSQLGGRRACVDCADYGTIEQIRKLNGNIAVDTEPFFLTRRIKDEVEAKVIAKASLILDRLYEICVGEIKVGVTERDLQAKLIYEAMKMGANPPSYKSTLNPLIIAGGPNGALPHAEVTSRKFRNKDMIVVDLTLRHQGYISDATRTFALGKPTAEMVRVYEIVRDSQEAGIAAATSGATCGEVDAACRNLIIEHGHERQFIHSTGHGIGLDVHEPPWVRAKSEEVLESNMAITIEPGIYLESKFGVRIEDSILVTGGKPKVLNRFTKDLLVL